MLGQAVPAGAIYHVKSGRRRDVIFGDSLRHKTEEAARRLHELVASGVVPGPVLHPKCKQCSLYGLCMPELLSDKAPSRSRPPTCFVLGSRDVGALRRSAFPGRLFLAN